MSIRPEQTELQLTIQRDHRGDAYTISFIPGRKRKALLRYEVQRDIYHPVAYFSSEDEANRFKDYMQEIIRLFAEAKGWKIPA
jgi:hypothetical protein